MRILFWNTGNRPVIGLLRELSRLRDVDILVLAELAVPIEDVVNQLNESAEQGYFCAQERLPKSFRRPLHVLTRLHEDRVVALKDGAGITVKRVFPIVGPDFTIVAVHLRSKLFQPQEDQVFRAASVNSDVEGIEAQVGHRRTLLIGDFNMNPFEQGLVSSDCFHAVMSRRTAQRQSRTIDGRERFFFYNPVWSLLGDHPPNPPGSYYRAGSGRTEYFWHSFDQVLLRPDLLDYFPDNGIEVLTRIGERTLLTRNGIPDANTGSDHLPLLLELSIQRGSQHGHTKPVAETEG